MATEKSSISILQEMAQVEGIQQPVYDVQPKGKEFRVTLKLGENKDIFTESVAENKQLANQLCAENALELLNRENTSFVQDEKEHPSAKSRALLSSSNTFFHNYVGTLNEWCSKSMIAVPEYNECRSENGEFIIECRMFDITTRGQSRTKKDAKQKAAEAMLKVYNGRETCRCQKPTEFREVECKNINEMTGKSSLLNGQFENYVGKLNELCSKKREILPSYRECGTKNGEFIIECRRFDNTITQGQSKTKKDAKQKAAEAMLNKIGELGSQNTTKSFTSSDDIVDLYKSLRSIMPFQNYVGKLGEICAKKMLPLPIYTERITENGEFAMDCKVIYNSASNVTQGQSKSKQAAKETAAKEMFQQLTECMKLESQNLMKSVTIMETDNSRQQKATAKFTEHFAVEQTYLSSVEHMNEEQLEMELKNLNVIHRITSIAKNALMLKTNTSENCKSFTFIASGKDRETISLHLLRKAVFGVRILKTN